ncbi:hypothetical protein CCAX7_51500 [Capsulimonas corticalis]|uniref:Uncharacterized protein n=1 Tax=Capsulimonas corticalis TaxID=2219043 RepID=A0A402CPF4_9BACT|nr:hypothetical protein [Capsulimonas corticalis]BDI33099.1 hypothetical protein CCAX7_51500 [Capsulimonas corticalis]
MKNLNGNSFPPALTPAVMLSIVLSASVATYAAPPLETIGGGTVTSPAIGPAPSFGLGGPNMTLVKNWRFGAKGTVKNDADMSANFYYHDQFGTINNGGKYGSNIVSPDAANAIGGQPIEGVDSPPVRKFMADSLRTYLTPLHGAAKVQVWNHNAGNGSFMSKWRLPSGGPQLGRDIVWETRVRYVTPPYFWFALWTAGNKWKWDGTAQGAEQDLVESFGYDNGGGNTNYDGRFWHSNSVANPSKDTVDYSGWGTAMSKLGIQSYDAAQYHIWTWVYKKDGSFAMYVDGIKVQSGSNYHWTYGNTAKDEPIDMDFLFDAGWGHNQIGSVNKELDASAFDGKYYEWSYSRVYLSGDGRVPAGGPRALPGTIRAADANVGGPGVAYGREANGGQWRKYTVQVAAGGHYHFRFQVTSASGGTFHVEDENGVDLTGTLTARAGSKNASIAAPATLSAGAHTLKWMQDGGGVKFLSATVVKAAGASAVFVKTDTTTQGAWKGRYGADGYGIAGDAEQPPGYGAISRTGWTAIWSKSTTERRALQKSAGTDCVAGQWGCSDKSYDIDCKFPDAAVHQVALYGVDWDANGRSETIQVVDGATGAVLDTEELNTYVAGKYLVWNVQGQVIFRVSVTSHWTNPALSGVFFDPPPRPSKKTLHQ